MFFDYGSWVDYRNSNSPFHVFAICFVPSREIDECLELVDKGVTITTFGDMLRVPGSNGSLAEAKAEGADIRVIDTKEMCPIRVGFDTLEACRSI